VVLVWCLTRGSGGGGYGLSEKEEARRFEELGQLCQERWGVGEGGGREEPCQYHFHRGLLVRN
jgi:hypothetical protein